MQDRVKELVQKLNDGEEVSSAYVLQVGTDVYQHSRKLLQNVDYLIFTQQCLIAALQGNSQSWIKAFYTIIQNQFPKSLKLAKIKGMTLQAQQNFGKAKQYYKELVECNPEDSRFFKRVIAIHKQQGQISHAIKLLKRFIRAYPNDLQCWIQLGQIYLTRLDYQHAQYCFEQLLTQFQNDPDVLLKLAEIHASQNNGLDNLILARKYYCKVLEYSESSMRAMLGLWYICKKIKKAYGSKNKPDDGKLNDQLIESVREKIESQFEDCNQKIPKFLISQ